VVKELAAAMGGSVAVASQPGAGATFAVSLPVASVRPAWRSASRELPVRRRAGQEVFVALQWPPVEPLTW
jgi:hypothetical protein